MSEAIRQEIADACSSVEGVIVSPHISSSTKAGTGSVRWAGLVRDNLGGLATWQVVLWLSSDMATAERFVDTKLPLVLDALRESRAMFPDLRVTAQTFVLDTAEVAAVVIEGQREEGA